MQKYIIITRWSRQSPYLNLLEKITGETPESLLKVWMCVVKSFRTCRESIEQKCTNFDEGKFVGYISDMII